MKFPVKTLGLVIAISIVGVACNSGGASSKEVNNTQPPAILQQPAQAETPTSTAATPTTAPAQTVTPAPQTVATLIPMEKAIITAETHSSGYAVEIELHQGHGNPVYDIETIQGTSEHRVQIDAVTGQVLSSYSERDLNLKPKATISLVEAIQIAQKNVAGQVIEATLDREYIGSHYEVKIRSTTGHPYEIKISASDGKVIKSRVDYDD